MEYWRAHLFDFRGRATRFRYWQSWVVGFAWLAAAAAVALPYALIEQRSTSEPERPLDAFSVMTIAGEGALAAAAFAAILAVYVRCLHDRDKGFWWLIAFFAVPEAIVRFASVPDALPKAILLPFVVLALVFMVWGIVELGFLRGTKGPNRFGPDPLGDQASL
ncbi:MAG: DUF805 domain-containing protein [Rhizomicrobium sp.]